MPADEPTATGGSPPTRDGSSLSEKTLTLRAVSPTDILAEKRVDVGNDTPKPQSKAPSSRDASKPSSFKHRTGDDSRPTSRSAGFRPEFSYDPNVPQDNAHVEAARIGEMPAQKLDKKLSKGKMGAKSFRRNLNEKAETPEESERIKRLSKAVSQQAIFKTEDMKGSLREVALEVASEAIVRGGWDNEVAAFIKKRMDKRQQSITGGKWHCIVGPDFGSYVTYERGHFCYFYLRRKLSPIEALEKARCERKQREEHEVQQQVTSTAPADSLAGGKPTEGEVSFKSAEESKLEGEIKQRASQAGFAEESTAPHDAHPMLDSRCSGQGGHQVLGKGEEDRLMVGILLWRT